MAIDINASSAARSVTRYNDACFTFGDDRLAVEEPLEIRVGPEPMAITMRTPGHDLELAAGFALTEGLVAEPDELESVEPCAEAKHGNVVIVKLTDEAMARRAEIIACSRRELYLSSSCGLCGRQSLDRVEQKVRPIRGEFKVTREVLDSLPGVMRKTQATFDQTGGLHAAGLFTPTGELRVLREDVGRHNAVDKVIGHEVLLGRLPIDPAVLLVSGRASFEIMQKAAMAGIAFVAAVSAPSSLAADFAQRLNMTLVGFLRPGRMNVYHDAGRIQT
jgi:FdhD protein